MAQHLTPLRRHSSRSALDVPRTESQSSIHSRGDEADENNGKPPEDDIFHEGPADPHILTKWDSGSPSSAWYETRFNKRRKLPSRSRRCSLGLAPVDVVLLLLCIGLLLLVQHSDRHRSCSVRPSDLALQRLELFRCKADIRAAKRLLRGKHWQAADTCTAPPSTLLPFLNSTPSAPCPGAGTPLANDLLESLLLTHKCQDIPRRHCLPHVPARGVDPLPLPGSLWAVPEDGSVVWEEYGGTSCRGFQCLMDAEGNASVGPTFAFSKGSDLPAPNGSLQWAPPSIANVLALKEPGTFRTGLDVWGGVGNFAAQVAERGITIVTTGVNQGLPVLQTLSLRGLPSLHLPFDSRLPFFDGALDLVHCAHWPGSVLQDPLSFEPVLFEWDRVLRPGGVLWLDRLPDSRRLLGIIAEIVNVMQMKKKRWKLRMKDAVGVDRAPGLSGEHRYAVLQKPFQRQ